MRTHDAANTQSDRQSMLIPLMAVLLMVVVPTLIVGMTRVTGILAQALLGVATVLALVVGGAYIYHLGKPA